MSKFLTVLIIILAFSGLHAESRGTPGFSVKMAGKESRFSLEDPRVALKKIKDAKSLKEPPIPPKGAKGAPLTAGEQEAVDTVEDLKKGYAENKKRPDGYGLEISREIIVALGEIKSKRSVDFLCGLLVDSKEILEFKEDIVEALRLIGDKKAVDPLKSHLEYLQKNKPADPMVAYTWQGWIDKTQTAINELEAK